MVIDSKIGLVTGAGSGIGQAFAVALLNENYKVVLAGRRVSKLQETVSKAGVKLSNALIVETDISNLLSVNNLFNMIKEKFGHLDLLFNNAGVNITAPLEDISFEQWKTVIDINLTGTFLCTQAAFKMMKSQHPIGGRIINNGSISAHSPRPNASPYNSSKSAITGLTKSTSLEGRKYNIACSQIDIGNVETGMAKKMNKGVLQANGSITPEPTMDLENVTNALMYIAGLPLTANVQFMTVMATNMPFIGRG